MWSLRILTGPTTGQILNLSVGKHRLGRGPQADIRIESKGISKLHAELVVTDSYIEVIDLNSANGTFVNGTRIKSTRLQLGQKISFFDVICDVVQLTTPQHSPMPSQRPTRQQGLTSASNYFGGAPQAQTKNASRNAAPAIESEHGAIAGLFIKAEQYLDEVVLPGVYKLPQATDYRYVVIGFIVLLIVATTALSVIPMLNMAQASVMKEAQRRTISLARNLAKLNEQALAQGVEAALSTNSIKLEDGVLEALIIRQSDGTIVAPVDRAGQSNNYTFTVRAIQQSREQLESFEVSKVGAAVPMQFYVPEIGAFAVKYYAVVVYDSEVLALDMNQASSLFVQTLIIALVIGGLVGFLLIRLIERPYTLLTQEVDRALRERSDIIKVPLQFPVLQNFIETLSPLLTRAVYGANDNESSNRKNVVLEAENLVQIIATPVMTYHPDGYIIAINYGFEQLLNRSLSQLQNQPMSAIPDQSLQKTLVELIDSMNAQPQYPQEGKLDFSNEPFTITCQAVLADDGQPAYYIFNFTPAFHGNQESA